MIFDNEEFLFSLSHYDVTQQPKTFFCVPIALFCALTRIEYGCGSKFGNEKEPFLLKP